ncbi:hypothetical protein C4J93_5229 [Pseudomonas sp. R2-37-08W]|nr:hypothetical protein C4J93_5229 [Pseudomonas sp. R2-37-08W]AZF60880.1 hypothetical protein C4J84_5051 [Pseudomonas sp. R11-23-07]
MWLAGRLKLKGMTAFSAESSWCKSAIGASAACLFVRNPLILL